MIYIVEVDGRTYNIEVLPDKMIIDGQPLAVDVRRIGDLPLYSLLMDNRSAEVSVEEDKRQQYRVIISGEMYNVLVRPAHASPQPERQHGLLGDSTIRAPMPGLVASIAVQSGAEVQAKQVLAVLESMKMENPLLAPARATVKQVHVQVGQPVDKGQEIVTLHFHEQATKENAELE